jgi:exosortase
MQPLEIAFALLLAIVFAPALRELAGVWSSVDYYSHGFLVPLVAGLVALGLARSNRALARHRDARGAVLLALALVGALLGALSSSASAQGLALVAAIAGAVWYLRGTAWLRVLAFPISYLVFMVPLPPAWLSPVIVQLLLFVTAGAVWALGVIGLPVLREGNVLTLAGGETLFVAEACSGLTSLVTLTPIAVLVAYLAPVASRWKLLLVALIVPIAMLANMVRVVGTALGASRWGARAVTDDPAHTLVGLGVYALACVLLLAIARMLPRDTSRRRRRVLVS